MLRFSRFATSGAEPETAAQRSSASSSMTSCFGFEGEGDEDRAMGTLLSCLGFDEEPPTNLSRAASVRRRLPHFRQLHAWDCGLACVQMVLASMPHLQPPAADPASLAAAAAAPARAPAPALQGPLPPIGAGGAALPKGGGPGARAAGAAEPAATAARAPAAAAAEGGDAGGQTARGATTPVVGVVASQRAPTWDELHRRCGTSSVWTIDLAYLLHAWGVRFVFTTTTIGCDPSYKDLSFYKKELSLDEQRVTRLFREALSMEQKERQSQSSRAAGAPGAGPPPPGVLVRQLSVPIEDIVQLLKSGEARATPPPPKESLARPPPPRPDRRLRPLPPDPPAPHAPRALLEIARRSSWSRS